MTLREIQLLICDKLNANEVPLQWHCKAFAEDALSSRRWAYSLVVGVRNSKDAWVRRKMKLKLRDE